MHGQQNVKFSEILSLHNSTKKKLEDFSHIQKIWWNRNNYFIIYNILHFSAVMKIRIIK